MFAHRFPFGCSTLACAFLIAIAGCNKSTSTGGAPPSPPKDDPSTLDPKELAAAKQESARNLQQLAIAMMNYHDAMGVYPTPGSVFDKRKVPPGIPNDIRSWRVKLLPYIEQDPLYKLAPRDPFQPIPETIAKAVVPTYLNPLKKKNPTTETHYRVFVGGGAFFEPDRPVRMAEITDGTSNTIMMVESAEPVQWSNPEDLRFNPARPLPKLGIFPGGFHAVMADGAVRWIPSDTPEAAIKAMISRAGNDYIELPGVYVKLTAIDDEKPVPPAQPKDAFAADKRKSINNLKQIGVAMHNYDAAFKDFPTVGVAKGMKAPENLPTPNSWRVAILPFLEQDNVWKLIPDNGRGAIPKAVADTVVPIYLSPLNKKPFQPISYYRVFAGNGAAFEWGRRVRIADFTDGTSNTILVVEAADPVPWSSLDDFNYDPKKPLPKLGIFPGGFHALMADGTVWWIPGDTKEETIRALITRNGGEVVKMPGMRVDKD